MTVKDVVLNVITSRPVVDLRRRLRFPGTAAYWDRRYRSGGTSGAGSYGVQANWKSKIVNSWVSDLAVSSVVDWGCGDGNQLSLADYPRYLGLDVSHEATSMCIRRFSHDPTRSFLSYDPRGVADPAGWLRADLALSMEVIFHLVDDGMFDDYLSRLFDSAERFVVICSSDTSDLPHGPHERHRPFTPWVQRHRPEWALVERVDPPPDVPLVGSLFLYRRT